MLADEMPGHRNSGPNASEVGLFGTMRPRPLMPRSNFSPTSAAFCSATEHPVSAIAARRQQKRVTHLTRSHNKKDPPMMATLIPPGELLSLYSAGWFPMAMADGSIRCFSPDPRGILPLEGFHLPHGAEKPCCPILNGNCGSTRHLSRSFAPAGIGATPGLMKRSSKAMLLCTGRAALIRWKSGARTGWLAVSTAFGLAAHFLASRCFTTYREHQKSRSLALSGVLRSGVFGFLISNGIRPTLRSSAPFPFPARSISNCCKRRFESLRIPRSDPQSRSSKHAAYSSRRKPSNTRWRSRRSAAVNFSRRLTPQRGS